MYPNPYDSSVNCTVPTPRSLSARVFYLGLLLAAVGTMIMVGTNMVPQTHYIRMASVMLGNVLWLGLFFVVAGGSGMAIRRFRSGRATGPVL
jgi:hypothetical protein